MIGLRLPVDADIEESYKLITQSKFSSIVIAAMLTSVSAVFSADFPNRPVRMVVPYPPGGSVDVIARIVAQKILEVTGQPMIIDNRPGAAGTIGTEIVVHSPADGYTIIMATIPLTVNASLYSKLPFDVVSDLSPISQIAAAPFVLTVNPSLAAISVKELIVLATARPGQINYASSGNGANLHIAAELFKNISHTDIVRIPYKGGGPALTALLANEVQVSFLGVVTVIPLVKAGRIRALGVTSNQRSAVMPELPTIAEAGLPGYEFTSWYAVLAPASLPETIVNSLNGHLVKAARSPDVLDRLAKEGADVIAGSPVQLREHLKRELLKWAKMVKESGLKPD